MVQALSKFIGPEKGNNSGRWNRKKWAIAISFPQMIHDTINAWTEA